MGRWIADFLIKDGKEVVLYGRDEEKLRSAGGELGVDTATDLSQAVRNAGLVIISVPIDNFTEVVKQVKPCLEQGQVVMDVTSVKVMPVNAMHEHLDNVTILGTHPVFGPGAKSARNQNFILTPTSDAERTIADKVNRNLTEKGGLVTIMTPEEHDHLMAVVLGLSHFIAIASADVLLGFEQLIKMKAIGGPTYKVLLTLAESVITEDPELYASIQMNLPGLPEMEELFRKSTETWADIVKSGNRRQFIEKMSLLKEKLPEADPDFGRSYRDMYKILDES